MGGACSCCVMKEEFVKILESYDQKAKREDLPSEDQKVVMSFQQYDEMLETFEKMKLSLRLPTLEDMDFFFLDLPKYLPYACFLDLYGKTPVTQEEKYRKKVLRRMLQDCLMLVD